MELIQIGVCDDESYMADLLSGNIKSYFEREQIEIHISRFLSGCELLRSKESFDLLFLDVQMSGLNGFETAKELRRQGFSGFLIFVTVMQEDVFQAFEVQAFDYLVKPLQEHQFLKTMDRLLSEMREHAEKQLLIQKGGEWTVIPFASILYCEIMNRKVYLHLNNDSTIDYYDKMEALEKKLDQRFFKCHRSYLVNMEYLKSFKKETAYLTNGETIPVSRLRAECFSTAVSTYMSRRRYGI